MIFCKRKLMFYLYNNYSLQSDCFTNEALTFTHYTLIYFSSLIVELFDHLLVTNMGFISFNRITISTLFLCEEN